VLKKISAAALAALTLLLLTLGLLELLFPVFLAANRSLRAPFSQAPGTINVYVLGESIAVGEPYQQKLSFPAILSYMYDGRLGGDRINIVNLARLGNRLEAQYWYLFRELVLRPPRAGLLLVYSGINDSFSGEDAPSYARWEYAQRSLLLSKLLSLSDSRFLMNYFGQPVSPSKYKYRLAALLRLAAKNDLKAVVSTLTGNFADFPPYKDPGFPTGADHALYNLARSHEAAGRCAQAGRLYATLLAKARDNPPMLHYRLGTCLAAAGDHAGAREQFYQAADQGSDRRPTRTQNETIALVAAAAGAGLARTAELFERESPRGVAGDNLFMDAHHPNLPGYLLLARSFSEEVSRLYGQAPAHPAPSAAEIRARFGLTPEDEFNAHLSRVNWFCAEAAFSDHPEELLKKAHQQVALADAIMKKAGGRADLQTASYFHHLLLAAAGRDAAGTARWLKIGDFLGANRGFLELRNEQFRLWFYELLKNSGLPETDYQKFRPGGGRRR